MRQYLDFHVLFRVGAMCSHLLAQGGQMWMRVSVRLAAVLVAGFCIFFAMARAAAQNQIMGEVQFSGATKVERDSGVWVDANTWAI